MVEAEFGDSNYILRNRLVLGGSTWKDGVNPAQVRHGAAILTVRMPIFSARKAEDRAKFIVGGYLLAQFKRNPEMAAELTPLIIAYVDQQRSASLRAADKALVLAMIDKHLGQTRHPIPLPPNKANRATIIIGAWLIDAASNDPALADAHGPGIRAFVDTGDTAKGREADMVVLKVVWGVSNN